MTTAACKITKICVVTTTFSLGKVSKTRGKLKSKFILVAFPVILFHFLGRFRRNLKKKTEVKTPYPRLNTQKLPIDFISTSSIGQKAQRKRQENVPKRAMMIYLRMAIVTCFGCQLSGWRVVKTQFL